MSAAQASPGRRAGFVRQSAVSSVAALVALLSGLLLDVVLAFRLGAGTRSDAFFAAARIPVGLTGTLTNVAIVSWVPLFTRHRKTHGAAGLTAFTSRLLSLVTLVGIALCGVTWLVARPLMLATAPGLDGHQITMAASTIRIMFLIVPLTAAAEVVRSALNASYSFVLPAMMNLFMNGASAAIVVAYHGQDIRVVAWAFAAGAALQLLVVTALAWVRGIRVVPTWRVLDTHAVQAVRASGRPTLGSVLNLGNRVVEQVAASLLPAGSVTVLSYAQRLISALGSGMLFRPLTVALLPRLADAEQAGDRDASARLVNRALRFALGLSLLLTAYTVALAGPAVWLVFNRGNFGPHATRLLGLTLAIYGASLVGSGLQRILLASFYARLDTRTPLRNTVFGVVVDCLLIVPCVALFGWHSANGILGIAIAYSVTQYFIVWHAWSRAQQSLAISPRRLGRFALAACAVAAVCTAVMFALVHAFGLGVASPRLHLVIVTAGIAVAGAVVVAGFAVPMIGIGGVRRLRG